MEIIFECDAFWHIGYLIVNAKQQPLLCLLLLITNLGIYATIYNLFQPVLVMLLKCSTMKSNKPKNRKRRSKIHERLKANKRVTSGGSGVGNIGLLKVENQDHVAFENANPSMHNNNSTHTEAKCHTSVILQDDISANPWCAHGPTILYQRSSSAPSDISDSKHKTKRFFACSAYRDRKYCPSFFPVPDGDNRNPSDAIPKEKKIRWKQILEQSENTGTKEIFTSCMMRYCHTCSKLISTDTQIVNHKHHDLSKKLREEELCQPTLNNILVAKNEAKKEAQFHFSKDTLNIIVQNFILEANEKLKVICVGVLRIHETLLALHKHHEKQSNIKSILLDIDQRLRDFYRSSSYSANTFCHYNMFNHHFFDQSEKKVYEKFLEKGHAFLIVTDPPFGGKCELIGRTLEKIRFDVSVVNIGQVHKPQKFDVMWVFPYYMEKQIKNSFPGKIEMSDFQVNYQKGGGNNKEHTYKDGLESDQQGSRKVCVLILLTIYTKLYL